MTAIAEILFALALPFRIWRRARQEGVSFGVALHRLADEAQAEAEREAADARRTSDEHA